MKPVLDWSAYKDAGMGDAYADIPKHGEDFARAVAVCINSRQCETSSKQLMCPSFKTTGNPALSTGGRVKLLKAALNGDLPDHALNNPEVAEAMALCVACKGCKRECEANIDMALIKAEYLAQRRKTERMSLRSTLFAHLPLWLHRFKFARRAVAWRNKSPGLAKVGEKMLGLSAAAPLPEPCVSPFSSRPVPLEEPAPDKPRVTLLVDTFSHHFEPGIAEAALEVLGRGGYEVLLAAPSAATPDPDRPLCCGRTYLAQGLIDRARAEAKRMIDVLEPHVAEGRTIVGLEASCVLGLRDDALALGLGEAARSVAGSILLLEEFLAKEAMAKRLDLPLGPLPDHATLVHGHCHQKAVGAMKAMRRVLKLIPEHDFSMIDAGCCGMAGTFGLEAERAEMSYQMANADLMPALAAAPDARVVANGFSCRHQMRAHGDERPYHLALLLKEALLPERNRTNGSPHHRP